MPWTASRWPQRRCALPEKGLTHLRRSDPVLAELIAQVAPKGLGDARAGRPDDHYGALLRAIVGQQLSTKAARSIFTRLTDRFDGRTPTPEQVLADDPEELRLAAGLSRPKVGYLRSLAEHVLSGELELERLDELPDEQVIAELVAVKGLGVWSAHMFLMFHLQRPDVLPVGDLGIRKAMQRAYELDELPGSEEMEAIAQPWRPQRTLACRYLWRSLDNEP
jgi:DNA-3-methyladenine glycosylase II